MSDQSITTNQNLYTDDDPRTPPPEDGPPNRLLVVTEVGPAMSTSDYSLASEMALLNSKSRTGTSMLKLSYWSDCGRNFFNAISNYLHRVFSFPLVREPISFTRPGDTTGDFDPSKPKEVPKSSEEVEDLCNYDEATKQLFAFILEERKKVMDAKDKYHYQEIDLSKFPRWDDSVIERLKSTFQVFDVTGDGLIDFEEMSSVLTEFGDKTTEEIRRRNFDAVDIDKSGAIDFEEFITMTYNLTMREKTDDSDPESAQLGESYRMIDRNMSRIRSLDVVQQLQAGLF